CHSQTPKNSFCAKLKGEVNHLGHSFVWYFHIKQSPHPN
ncbi:MAG: hypothetical protein ACI9YU_001506, partial [Flavobacteriales bacterium]